MKLTYAAIVLKRDISLKRCGNCEEDVRGGSSKELRSPGYTKLT